jgi:hypothetical protein
MISSGTNGDLYDGKGPPVKAFPHPKTHHLVILYRGSPLPKVLGRVRSYPQGALAQERGLNSKEVLLGRGLPLQKHLHRFHLPHPNQERVKWNNY